MLREEVVDAVKAGKFHIYSAKTIDEGIEILTGMPFGERKKDGSYPKDTINYRVDAQLKQMAERLKSFISDERVDGKKSGQKIAVSRQRKVRYGGKRNAG